MILTDKIDQKKYKEIKSCFLATLYRLGTPQST